jgi:hypothetical protein
LEANCEENGPFKLENYVAGLPFSSPSGCPQMKRKQIVESRHPTEQAGHDPKTISITAFAALPDRKVLDRQEAAGAERAIFFLPAAGTGTILPLLDQYAKLI